VARQNRPGFRDLAGGGARGRMADGIAGIAGDAVTSGEENAHYGPDMFCDLAVPAAVLGHRRGGRGTAMLGLLGI